MSILDKKGYLKGKKEITLEELCKVCINNEG